MLTNTGLIGYLVICVGTVSMVVGLCGVHRACADSMNLYFSVVAGADQTSFFITRSSLEFDPPLINPLGWVDVTYILTDTDGDGATLQGLGSNGGAFLAQYNGYAGAPGGPQGTTFAEGIFSMTAEPYQTVTATFEIPAVTIEGTIKDISLLAHFELSAFDTAQGSCDYSIIPEPATLVLWLLACIAVKTRSR